MILSSRFNGKFVYYTRMILSERQTNKSVILGAPGAPGAMETAIDDCDVRSHHCLPR